MSGVYLRRRGVKKRIANIFVDVAPTVYTGTVGGLVTPNGKFVRCVWDLSAVYNDYENLTIADIIPVAADATKTRYTPLIGYGVLDANIGAQTSKNAAGGFIIKGASGFIPSSCFIQQQYQSGSFTLWIGQSVSADMQNRLGFVPGDTGFSPSDIRLVIVRKIDYSIPYAINIVNYTENVNPRNVQISVGKLNDINGVQSVEERRCGYLWMPYKVYKSSGRKRPFLDNLINLAYSRSGYGRTRLPSSRVGESSVSMLQLMRVNSDLIVNCNITNTTGNNDMNEYWPADVGNAYAGYGTSSYFITVGSPQDFTDNYDTGIDIIGNLETMEVITAP